MPTELGFRRADSAEFEPVDDTNPLPVNTGVLTSNSDSVLARQGSTATVNVQGVSTVTSSTTILSYTVPQGTMAFVPNAIIINLAGTPPTIRLRYTPSGGTVEILAQATLSATTYTNWAVQLYMAAGDVLDFFVSTGGAGSSANAVISVLQTTII